MNALYAAEKKLAFPRVIKAAFEFRIAALIGYEPDLAECPICGKGAGSIKNRMFELTDGYLFCGACDNPEEGFTRRVRVSDACYAAMKHLLTVPVNKIFLFRLEETALAELCALTEEYLLLRVEKKLKTLDFLKKSL